MLVDTFAARVPGWPGITQEQAQPAEARTELERLRATVTEQPVALHLQREPALFMTLPCQARISGSGYPAVSRWSSAV
ncbi:hypothetical protein ACWF95_37745 [Streptomyces vinaceus]